MSEPQRQIDRYGAHRVLEPAGALPQNALRLDNTTQVHANEILCAVEWLNIDSASFRQIDEACAGDIEQIQEHIRAGIATRGKQHNAITGSGGMFIGTIAEIGHERRSTISARVGDRIASLVSLTLTPLALEEILEVDRVRGRLRIRGWAILCESAHFAHLPPNLSPTAALALFDVAGAPAQVARLVKPGMRVLILGADGKSGLLACAAARTALGQSGALIGLVPQLDTPAATFLLGANLVDSLVEADARDALTCLTRVQAHLPQLADLVVSCVNVAGAELAAILSTRERGMVYFFSMATSFSAAALGAEGVGKDIDMLIGNGYVKNHVQTALATLHAFPSLTSYFLERYGAEMQPSDSGQVST